MMLKVLLTSLVAFLVTVLYQTYDRKSRSGGKPILKCIVDVLCSYVMVLRWGPWAEDSYPGTNLNQSKISKCGNLIKSVMESTGLTDFGGNIESFANQYDRVLLGIQKSNSRLSPFAYLFLRESLKKKIEARLQLEEFFKRRPEVNDIPVSKPVFVIGLTRTGTTFLHELLGLYPGGRSHLLWEQLTSVPLTTDESMSSRKADRKRRHDATLLEFKIGLALMDEKAFQRIHRVGYDLPEECTNVVSCGAPLNVPTLPYMVFAAQECLQLGAGDAFVFYRKWLKMMTWQDENRHGTFNWILKCPFFLPYLSELHESFPDATVVWTHRDPVECIGSACSLYEALLDMSVDSWTIDRVALGKAVLEYTKICIDKAEEKLSKLSGSINIVHVRYSDLVKDPKRLIKDVLAKTDLSFEDNYERQLDDFLARNAAERNRAKDAISGQAPGEKNPKAEKLHPYSLEKYGLTEALVTSTFRGYIERFKLR